jgi:hypothetical protein
MTFLLFLASVAVLEYLVRDVRHKSGGLPEASEIRNVAAYEPVVSEATSTTDLLSLGKALDAQAAVKATDSEYVSKKR